MLPVSNTDLAVGTGTFPVLFVVLTRGTSETSSILLLNNGCVVGSDVFKAYVSG